MQQLKASFNNQCSKFYAKVQQFIRTDRGEGDAPKWVVGVFFSLVLMIFVYLLFKDQIEVFVKDKIFGKMNSLS